MEERLDDVELLLHDNQCRNFADKLASDPDYCYNCVYLGDRTV